MAAHKHAHLRLRVVTYNYGDRYLDDYLLKEGSGIFIERHEFIQAITPLTPECGGFVLLGREVTVEAEGGTTQQLELVACPVPYGFTLLVEVGSIHGDSTLTGLYMMAMTGNHVAMATADTVFLKHRCSRANVRVSCTEETAPPVVPGLPGSAFLLTSDEKTLEQLHEDNDALKVKCQSEAWKPVVTTGPQALGWEKTMNSLPVVRPQPEPAFVVEGAREAVPSRDDKSGCQDLSCQMS